MWAEPSSRDFRGNAVGRVGDRGAARAWHSVAGTSEPVCPRYDDRHRLWIASDWADRPDQRCQSPESPYYGLLCRFGLPPGCCRVAVNTHRSRVPCTYEPIWIRDADQPPPTCAALPRPCRAHLLDPGGKIDRDATGIVSCPRLYSKNGGNPMVCCTEDSVSGGFDKHQPGTESLRRGDNIARPI
jgi:hypothetical protein